VFKQVEPNLFFRALNLAGNRWLRDAKSLGSMREMLPLADRHKVA
jgi:hypothetical protein